MVGIAIAELVVRFGTKTAVDRVSLSIEPQELFLLLGPSGCGKTTLLRAVAGFVDPSAGSIRFGGDDVSRLPPHARNAGMVFQSFALWPHMTVGQNVAFGLRERGLEKTEIAARVEGALESTQISGFGPRRIEELSGGEQQRVALARALVVRPRCLLLDEPLASLDAKLRRSMREEIRRICKSSGLTTIYVTHDQKEALAIADRVGVMQGGRILQVGPPGDIYRRPRSRAVAGFVGETNLVEGSVTSVGASEIGLESSLGALSATTEQTFVPRIGERVWISIRPECLTLAPDRRPSLGPNAFQVRRSDTVYLGEFAEHHFRIGESRLSMHEINPRPGVGALEGETTVQVDAADVVLLPFDENREPSLEPE
jgi:iron(III) transport system ATP-binding protein